MISAMTAAVRQTTRVRRLTSAEQIELARAAREGDTAARNQLVADVLPIVVRRLQLMSGRNQADDVFQEITLRVMRLAEEWDPPPELIEPKFGQWIAARMRLLVIRAFAKRRLRPGLVDDSEDVGFWGNVRDVRERDPVEIAATREEMGALRERLDALGPRRRMVLLRAADGEMFRSIGDDLGCTGPNVSYLFKSGLARLRTLYGCEHVVGDLEYVRNESKAEVAAKWREYERRRREKRPRRRRSEQENAARRLRRRERRDQGLARGN